jgi:hypothetical protein
MKDHKLSEKSIEELQKTKKNLQLITGMLVGAIIVLFSITMYITLTKGFTPLMIVAIALLPIAVLNFGTVNRIKKEIESREKS